MMNWIRLDKAKNRICYLEGRCKNYLGEHGTSKRKWTWEEGNMAEGIEYPKTIWFAPINVNSDECACKSDRNLIMRNRMLCLYLACLVLFQRGRYCACHGAWATTFAIVVADIERTSSVVREGEWEVVCMCACGRCYCCCCCCFWSVTLQHI